MQPIQSQIPTEATLTRRQQLRAEVRGFCREDRHAVLPRLGIALAESGCWLTGCSLRRPLEVEYRLDMELRFALDLYGGLVGAGLELAAASHRELTGLCVLRQNAGADLGRVVNLTLILRFVEAPA